MSDSPMGDEASPSQARISSKLPARLKSASESPSIPLKSWQKGVGPAFLSLALSVVLLDRLAPTTLIAGGLGPSVIAAMLAGLLSYWCLYYASAMWGVRSRKPLTVVASRTFGTAGVVFVPALLLVAVHIIWFAVTIEYAVQYALSGLVACGLLDPKHLASNHRGGWSVPKPLFLAVAASWSLTSAVIGTLAVRLVSAIMYAYVIFPVLVIVAATIWAIPAVSSGPIEPMPFTMGGGRAITSMIQLVFAFLAAQGLTNIEWGAVTTNEKDVRSGGLAGVMLATPILVVLSLLIVAGSLGRTQETLATKAEQQRSQFPQRVDVGRPNPVLSRSEQATPAPTLRDVFLHGIGGRLGGAALLILALALLGPACTNPYEIARYSTFVWPRIPRWAAALIGASATWPLIALGWTKDLESVFSLLGAMTAPVLGAIAADFAKSRGQWLGPRHGINLAGFAAWILGIGAAFAISRWGDFNVVTRYLPSSVVGFGTGFIVYLVLASLKLESPTIHLGVPGV